jgi:hypothetical protein
MVVPSYDIVLGCSEESRLVAIVCGYFPPLTVAYGSPVSCFNLFNFMPARRGHDLSML